jgi:uncharacterized protein YukE
MREVMMAYVDPAAIRSLADKFDATADSLAQQANKFAAGAHLSSDAFGTLPAGRQAFADYAERLQHASGSLQQIERSLQQFASNLRTVATNWELADGESTVRP